MTRPEVLLLVVAMLALACLALVALVRRRRSSTVSAAELCRAFGLDPVRYRVLGADVGGFRVPFDVRADGLIGRPDAVFRAKDRDEVVVGEVKSRRHQGRITRYERYQMTLYQGAVRAQLRTEAVRGLLRYRDRIVEAPFCAHTYRDLLSLKSEYRQARGAAIVADG